MIVFKASPCRDESHDVKKTFDMSTEWTALIMVFCIDRMHTQIIVAMGPSILIITIIHLPSLPSLRSLVASLDSYPAARHTIMRVLATTELRAVDSMCVVIESLSRPWRGGSCFIEAANQIRTTLGLCVWQKKFKL